MVADSRGNPVIRVAALLALLAVGYMFITDIGKEKPKAAPAGQSDQSGKAKESAWIAEMQIRVKGQLKDPDSAQFQNSYISRRTGVPLVCGRVNSNNSYGGKAGYQRFVAAGDIIAIEEQMSAGEMDKLWHQAC